MDGTIHVLSDNTHTHTHTHTLRPGCNTTTGHSTDVCDRCVEAGDSLKVFGGLGSQGDDGVGGERSFDLRGQSVDGEPLLLTNIAADRRQLSP